MTRTLLAVALLLAALGAQAAESADASILHATEVRILFGHDQNTTTLFIFAWLVNDSSGTYVSDGAALVFAPPEGASHTLRGELATPAGSRRLTEATATQGIGLALRVPPGHSNLRLEYHTTPYQAPAHLHFSLPFKAESTHLFVAPQSVKVAGTPTSLTSHDDKLGLDVYRVDARFPGEVAFTFTDSAPPQKQASEDDNMDVKPLPNRFSQWMGYVLLGGLLLVLFAFGLSELVRSPGRGGTYNLSSAEHAALKERLYDDLASLERSHDGGEVSDAAFRDERRHLRLQISLLLEQEETRG